MTKEKLNDILDNLYKEALRAKNENEIPVAACLILENGKTFYAHNEVEKRKDPYAHAEFLALNEALKDQNSKYLKNSILIVTLEPCLLCMGALLKAGVTSLYYVLPDDKAGALSHYHAFVDDRLSVMEIEDNRFLTLMNDFFLQLRNCKE